MWARLGITAIIIVISGCTHQVSSDSEKLEQAKSAIEALNSAANAADISCPQIAPKAHELVTKEREALTTNDLQIIAAALSDGAKEAQSLAGQCNAKRTALVETGSQTETAPVGCFGHSIDECIESVEAVLVIDPEDVTRERQFLERRDVNGKLINGNFFGLSGKLRGSPRVDDPLSELKYEARIDVFFAFNAHGVVNKASSTLAESLDFSQTEAEYDRSGAFEIVRMLAGPSCMSDKMDFFRFLENNVKPTMGNYRHFTDIDPAHASSTDIRSSKKVAFCHNNLTYSYAGGYDTELINLDNPHGVDITATITVE